MDADRLPGGLGVWAGRRFLLRYRGRFVRRVLGPIVYWSAFILFIFGFWRMATAVPLRVFLVLIAVVTVLQNIRSLKTSWGAPVTAQTQPALYAVVQDVAGRLDVPMPDGLWLMSFGPAVRLFPDGRRPMLRFHLAAVSCLTRPQLEALIAHELAALRYPRRRLVLRLRAACLEELDDYRSRRRRATRNLARLSPFWSTVEDDADAAATTFATADEAAEAVVIGELAGLEYTAYQLDMRQPKSEGAAIQDVDEGWPHFVGHGDAPPTMDDDHPDEARYHRSLAGPIARLGEVRLRLPDDRVVLEKIAEKEQRDLEPELRSGSRWYTFATAPQQWWLERARNDAEQVRGWAEKADDAEADDDAALLDTLLRRADDRRLWLNLYAEYRLLADGWRLEHPAVRGVLVDPAGARVDITRMDPAAVRELISPTLVA